MAAVLIATSMALGGCAVLDHLASGTTDATPHEVSGRTAAEKWAAAATRGDVSALASLYAADAVLWGPSASAPRRGVPAIRDYYAQTLRALGKPRIVLREQYGRVVGEASIVSGTYSVMRVGSEALGRHTIVSVQRQGQWLIVEHHMSMAVQ
jgi:uncharacterized protein (TIGR02246 family)